MDQICLNVIWHKIMHHFHICKGWSQPPIWCITANVCIYDAWKNHEIYSFAVYPYSVCVCNARFLFHLSHWVVGTTSMIIKQFDYLFFLYVCEMVEFHEKPKWNNYYSDMNHWIWFGQFFQHRYQPYIYMLVILLLSLLGILINWTNIVAHEKYLIESNYMWYTHTHTHMYMNWMLWEMLNNALQYAVFLVIYINHTILNFIVVSTDAKVLIQLLSLPRSSVYSIYIYMCI